MCAEEASWYVLPKSERPLRRRGRTTAIAARCCHIDVVNADDEYVQEPSIAAPCGRRVRRGAGDECRRCRSNGVETGAHSRRSTGPPGHLDQLRQHAVRSICHPARGTSRRSDGGGQRRPRVGVRRPQSQSQRASSIDGDRSA